MFFSPYKFFFLSLSTQREKQNQSILGMNSSLLVIILAMVRMHNNYNRKFRNDMLRNMNILTTSVGDYIVVVFFFVIFQLGHRGREIPKFSVTKF